MKKLVFPLVVIALILTSSPGVMAQNDEDIQRMGKIVVYLEDEELDLDHAPYIKDERAMIPLRDIMEALDAHLDYQKETQTVTITREERSVELIIDSKVAKVNGETMDLDAAPEIMSDHTFVPLRFVADAVGAEIEWDGEQRRIDISRIVDIESITVIPDDLLLQSGEIKTVEVKIELEDGSTEEVSASDITWSSSDDSVATVEEGVIEAVDEGTATITAEFLGHEVSVSVDVDRDLPVEFSSENRRLESVIRNELDRPTGAIYRSDMAKITHLEANDARIENLEEIRYCTNLKTLSLIGNRISDLGHLANLTSLERIELGHNQINDLKPLSRLENLQWLALNDNRIYDIEPLSELTNLTWLSLSRNEISDISGLVKLSEMESLDISDNDIRSLDVEWNMPSLNTFLLRDNQVVDLSPLKDMERLSVVNASGNRIKDVSMMVHLPRLMWLAIYDNDIDQSAESDMQSDIWKLEDRGVYVQKD